MEGHEDRDGISTQKKYNSGRLKVMRISIDQSADRFDFNKTDAAVEYQQARMSDKGRRIRG
jgi:hypothetical protein